MKVRKEQQARVEAILTEEQRNHWKAMLGPLLDLKL